ILLQLPEKLNTNEILEVRSKEKCILIQNSDIGSVAHVKLILFNEIQYKKLIELSHIKLENGVNYVKDIPEGVFNSILMNNSNDEFLKNDFIYQPELNDYRKHLHDTLCNVTVKRLSYDNVYGWLAYNNSNN